MSTLPNPIHFSRNIPGLPATATIDVTSGASDSVLLALAQDKPLPVDDVDLGDVKVQAGGSGKLAFLGGSGSVDFSADAQGFAGILVSPNPQKIKAALKRDGDSNSIIENATLPPIDANFRYWMLRWGYDASASASGSIALGGGPGQVSFGAKGSVDGLFAVVRRLAKNDIAGQPAGAFTQLSATVNSWILPSQFRNIGDLDVGTWIISEIDGALALSLSAQYGYNFNWVHQATLGGLSGDVGLKIQMGIFASLGFSATGSFAVVLSRESAASAVRLQVMKLDRKGWDFALNASAAVTPDPGPLLSAKFDDFIAGVFGTNGLQVLKDIDTWTDPNAKLQDLLGSQLVDTAEKLLTKVTGIDANAEFDKAKGIFQQLLTKWTALPHDAASSLYDILKNQTAALAPFKEGLQIISNGDTQALLGLLGRVDFSRTPIGQFIEQSLATSALDAITNRFGELQTIAKAALGILDGSTVEQVLTNLQQQIDQLLGVDKIANLTFDQLNDWLKARLSDWLGKDVAQFQAEFQKIQAIVRNLRSKANDFYTKVRAALTNTYSFQFSAEWQRTSTGSALLDVVFAMDGSNAATVLQDLLFAIKGQFQTFLNSKDPIPGITINQATLSHGVRRQTHVEVTLPFLKIDTTHINDSFASKSVVDHDATRLLVFEVGSTDSVTVRGRRDSRLAIAFTDKVPTRGLRLHEVEGIRYNYSFRQASAGMRKDQLAFQARPLIDNYFAPVFQRPGVQSPATWLQDFDNAASDKTENSSNLLGDTLLSLDVTLPGKYVGAWFAASQNNKDEMYKQMSLRLQAKFKELICAWYTQDPSHFKAPTLMLPVLIYCSIEPALPDGDPPPPAPPFIWDATDAGQRNARIHAPATTINLAAIFNSIQTQLADVLSHTDLGFYDPRAIRKILNNTPSDFAITSLGALFFTEAQLVSHAVGAAVQLAKFVATAQDQPDQARQALENFGSQVTSTFNNVNSRFGGGAFNALGTMLFVEAAIALDPTLTAAGSANALLDVTVVKNFVLATFIDSGEIPTADQLILEQKIPGIGTAS